jgi:peptidoglycan hydrolase-like protein with peptidoglycan-binding domain
MVTWQSGAAEEEGDARRPMRLLVSEVPPDDGLEEADEAPVGGPGEADLPPAAYGDYHWVSPGTRTLRMLDAGDDVTFLQARLGVRADGYFGPVTAAALCAFRRSQGLSAEPVAGREVWSLFVAAAPPRRRRRWWSAAPRPAGP